MSVAVDLAVRTVLLPALAGLVPVGIAVWLTRSRSEQPSTEPVREAAGLLGVLGGLIVAFYGLVGAPEWPAPEAGHWLIWSAILAGALAGLDLGLRVLSARGDTALTRQRALLLFLRVLPPVLVCVLVSPRMFATLIEHSWKGDATGHLMAVAGAVLACWAGLDLAAARLAKRDFSVLMGLLAAGSAGVIAVGQTALFGQLVGGLAAAIGGAALIGVFTRHEVPLRAAALPAAVMIVMTAVAARHFAYLSTWGVVLVAAAPLLAAGLAWVAKTPDRSLIWRAAPLAVLVLVLGTAAALGPQAEEAAPGSMQEELDYGYDNIDLSSEPDYGAMGDWKPPAPKDAD